MKYYLIHNTQYTNRYVLVQWNEITRSVNTVSAQSWLIDERGNLISRWSIWALGYFTEDHIKDLTAYNTADEAREDILLYALDLTSNKSNTYHQLLKEGFEGPY